MLQQGQTISDTYEVEGLLGTGGMANVYVVRHLRMPRKLALKVLHVQANSEDDVVARFEQEAKILAELRHPHIVNVTDFNWLSQTEPYLVMELLEGEDLFRFLQRNGPLSIPIALRIICQVGEALEAAHVLGVVHRDLKPSNIFLCTHGQTASLVKVLDFGVAKLTGSTQTPMTGTWAMVGTPGYMAPEQAKADHKSIGPATDQFALATILYEMLAGQPAFYRAGEGMYATLERVVLEKPAPLVDSQIDWAVQKALSKDPKDRFSSIREFLAAVGATSHTVYSRSVLPSMDALPTPAGEHSLIRRNKRSLLWKWGMGAVGVCVLCAGLFGLKKGGMEKMKKAVPVPVTSSVRENVVHAVQQQVSVPVPVVPVQRGPEQETGNASQTKNGKRPSAKSWSYVLGPEVDVHPKVRTPIRRCATRYLTPLRLPNGTMIYLGRSGILSLLKAPGAVLESRFNECLRQQLVVIAKEDQPKQTSIRVERN